MGWVGFSRWVMEAGSDWMVKLAASRGSLVATGGADFSLLGLFLSQKATAFYPVVVALAIPHMYCSEASCACMQSDSGSACCVEGS